MKELQISGLTDSKQIELAEYNSDTAHKIYLRLRLEILLRILFQKQMLVPEGWALDSLPFLKVSSEVIRAAKNLRENGRTPQGINQFDPFVMENRGHDGYLGVFLSYLERPSVRWSGFTPLRGNPEVQESLAQKIIANKSSGFGLVRSLEEVLGNEAVAENANCLANYFSIREKDRVLMSSPPSHLLKDNFHYLFQYLSSQMDFNENLTDVARPLLEFSQDVQLRGIDFTSLSPVVDHANASLDVDTKEAVLHLLNFHYMIVSSDASTSSKISLLPVQNNASDILKLADSIISKISGKVISSGTLDIIIDDLPMPDFKALIEKEDWGPIWRAVIKLSLNPQWQKTTAAVKQQYSEGVIGEELSKTPQYREMNSMLSNEVPDMVVDYSGADRFGLRLNKKWQNRAELVNPNYG